MGGDTIAFGTRGGAAMRVQYLQTALGKVLVHRKRGAPPSLAGSGVDLFFIELVPAKGRAARH